MVLVRRAYETTDGIKVKVDEELGLPKDKWLPMVLELACALGVSSEFPNSHSFFWSSKSYNQIKLGATLLGRRKIGFRQILQEVEG